MRHEWKNRILNTDINILSDTIYLLIIVTVMISIRKIIMTKLANKILQESGLKKSQKKLVETKFRGSLYRFITYSTFITYGIITTCNEEWLLSPFKYTLSWPNNFIPSKVKFYYFMEFSYYFSSLILLFYEPRMSDFYQMVLHHIITLFLIFGSYFKNLLRYGVTVMIIHDISDPFMEFAKLNFYLKKQRKADIVFSIFASVFIISRGILFPGYIILPAGYFCIEYSGGNIFLLLILAMAFLFVLNVIWAFFIIKMVIKFAKSGTIKGDIRTDDSETVEKLKGS
ncbi:TLC domain-containing protein [Hamiltosporidium magnivora]|uniref:TLC domain-containing protein n=1 Tax=Hamiltosporidium magnivora TaxID=148818 RepID=A0A4Q9LFI1_9MICR|nr:TLC domain-containing protein [Hamiltosporidium magnivora]